MRTSICTVLSCKLRTDLGPEDTNAAERRKKWAKKYQGMKKYELEYRSSRLLQGALVPIIYEKYNRICTYA